MCINYLTNYVAIINQYSDALIIVTLKGANILIIVLLLFMQIDGYDRLYQFLFFHEQAGLIMLPWKDYIMLFITRVIAD